MKKLIDNLEDKEMSIMIIDKEKILDNGWTSDKISILNGFLDDVLYLQNVHRSSRIYHDRIYKFINIPLFMFSTISTIFSVETSNDYISEIWLYWIRLIAASFVTFMTLINNYFHNEKFSEQHHNASRNYNMLYIRGKAIRENLGENEYFSSYQELIKIFEDARKGSPAIPNKARKIISNNEKRNEKMKEKMNEKMNEKFDNKLKKDDDEGYEGDEENSVSNERKKDIKKKILMAGRIANLSLKPKD